MIPCVRGKKNLSITVFRCYFRINKGHDHILLVDDKKKLSRKLHLDPFCPQTSPQLFLLCHQMKTDENISWWVFSTRPWPLE